MRMGSGSYYVDGEEVGPVAIWLQEELGLPCAHQVDLIAGDVAHGRPRGVDVHLSLTTGEHLGQLHTHTYSNQLYILLATVEWHIS